MEKLAKLRYSLEADFRFTGRSLQAMSTVYFYLWMSNICKPLAHMASGDLEMFSISYSPK